jgi:hypothetical protein
MKRSGNNVDDDHNGATTKMKMETTKEATTNGNNVDDNYEQAPTTNFMKITIITTETISELSVTEPATTQDDDDEPTQRRKASRNG